MPIDATIIPTKQQIPDFAGAATNLLNLQNSNLQYQRGQQELMQAQQAMAANQAVSRAMQGNIDEQGNINIPAVMQMLSDNPAAAYKLPEIAASMGNAQAGLTNAQTAQLANAAKQIENIMPTASDWVSQGDKLNHDYVLNSLSKLVATNQLSPAFAQVQAKTMPAKDASPQEWQDWAAREFNTALGHQEAVAKQLGTYVADTGSGQPGVVNLFTKKVTPLQFPVQGVEGDKQSTGEIESQLVYQPRKPGEVRPLQGLEGDEQKQGNTYLSNLMSRKANMSISNRNLDEVIKKAEEINKKYKFNLGSTLGDIESKIRGTTDASDLQELKKNLANVVSANEGAMGGQTDAGRRLAEQSVGAGEHVISPSVIIDIAKRAKGDNANINMQADAAQKFARRYGMQNYKTFQSIWGNEAESRIFQIQSMLESPEFRSLPKEKQIAERNSLLGISAETKPEERKKILSDFQKRSQRLEKLRETGTL
jgi:hypothetical protein